MSAETGLGVGASVVVCTFDRPRLLRATLESLGRDGSAPASWELLLIDNGGCEATREVAAAFVERLPLRVIREEHVGKSCALNAAVANAAGELLLFADDDVEVRPGWMGAFVAAAASAPRAGWFGGRSIPKWGEGAPVWVRRGVPEALRGYCCHYDLGLEPREYRPGDPLPIGASMAVRASTFRAIGGFDERVGPRGRERGVGEDTDLLRRAAAGGIAGLYVPAAVVDHFVPAERLTRRAILRYGLLKGRQQAIAEGRRAGRLAAAGRALDQSARGAVQWARRRSDLLAVCLLNVGLAIGAARRGARGDRSAPS